MWGQAGDGVGKQQERWEGQGSRKDRGRKEWSEVCRFLLHHAQPCSSRSCEWLCWIFQSPQGEITNRKLAVFSFHPLCMPGCPGAQAKLQEWEGQEAETGKVGVEGWGGEGEAPLKRPFRDETGLGRGTGEAGPWPAQRSSSSGTQETVISTAGPPYPRILHPLIQPTMDQKYLKKFPES